MNKKVALFLLVWYYIFRLFINKVVNVVIIDEIFLHYYLVN
ncbi:MAG: hypothetical protein ACRC6K_07615 [Fusobacteriaceae bacterium]